MWETFDVRSGRVVLRQPLRCIARACALIRGAGFDFDRVETVRERVARRLAAA
jgi:hypothetical protein